jgi:heptosyltransferase III
MNQKILIVRQDNIGDLVCTMPLIEGLHNLFQTSSVSVLCTSYNRAVLEGNPCISDIWTYAKSSHHASLLPLVRGSLQKALLIFRLRKMRIDLVVAATTPCNPRVSKLIGMLRPKRWIRSDAQNDSRDSVPGTRLAGKHEVERVWEVGKLAGLQGAPPPLRIYSDATRVAARKDQFRKSLPGRTLAVHISSRKPSQQWSSQAFAELLTLLAAADPSLGFAIFWAPGPVGKFGHSGDDAKAADLAARLGPTVPVVFVPTPELSQTIDALAACDLFVGSDGGAMHVAAACGLPIVALFGASDVTRWHPWTEDREVFQSPSKDAKDIAPPVVAAAVLRLLAAQGTKNASRR